MKFRLSLLVLVLSAATACVPHDRYDAALKDAKSAHASADKLSADLVAARAEIDRLNAALKAAQDGVDQRDRSLADGALTTHDLQTKLDDATALNEQLRVELERLGKNADALVAEKGSLATALNEAKARLEELRKAQAAADQRAALFRQLALKFQKMIDSGQLKIKLRDGRMVIELANDVLFDSGQTVVKPEGQKAIAQVATVLRSIPNRRYQVAGHTDNVPIQSGRFHSNWDLSTARAVSVVNFLITQGLKPELLSASGYGEFDPVAPNDTPQDRAKNRRIEITLQPNIDELVAVPDAAK
ncbi:MAG TPA: OmpA family protein [Polyangiaceae bacterium]|jgi:chemotaxis protein MotB|nr:OmpA family protein [Polyangiaceae bacterium]